MDDGSRRDASLEELLERVAAARDEGQSMEQMLQMAGEALSEQERESPDPQRAQLIEQVQLLQTEAPLLEEVASAETPQRGFGALLRMFGNLAAKRPESEKQAQRENALAALARAGEEQQRQAAAHVRERLARGLSERAGTGAPFPRVVLEDASGAAVRDEEESKGKLRQIGIGVSRLGGVPDLPVGVGWPAYQGKKLPFLGQINLADVTAVRQTVLPATGWLYAFGLFDNEDDHWPSPVAVFWRDAPQDTLARAAWPADDEIWPDWAGERVYEPIPLRAKKRASDDSAGWLFGEPEGYYGTPGEMADSAMLDGDDWVLLLAIESVGSMEWSDCGHLYLLARRSDLERQDFSRVHGEIRSS